MNEQNFIQTGNEKLREEDKKQKSFESAKSRLAEMEAYIKDMGNKMPREDSMKFEGDILYEIMPVLEEKKNKLQERLANSEDKVKKAIEPDVVLFYEEFVKKEKEELEKINNEIDKYQDLLDKLK